MLLVHSAKQFTVLPEVNYIEQVKPPIVGHCTHTRFGSSDIKPIPKFNVIASIWVIITYSTHAHRW